MRDRDYYRQQAAGCWRLLDGDTDVGLALAIVALARRYESLAALWPSATQPVDAAPRS